LRLGEDHREQEVVPCLRELPDQHDHETGNGDGQQYLTVDTQHVRPVDLGCLHQFIRNAGVVIAEGEGRDGNAVDDVHQDQARDAAIKTDRIHELYQRDKDGLVGDEHTEQDQREDNVRTFEFPFCQYVPVQRSQYRGEDRGRDYHLEAVQQVGSQLFEGFQIIFHPHGFGQIPHRLHADLIAGFKSGDHHDVNGDQVEDDQ